MKSKPSRLAPLLLPALAAACLATACAKPEQREWEPATTRGPTRVEALSGVLSEPEPGRLVLTPCGVNMALEVKDETGGVLDAARSSLGAMPGRDVFVDLRVERGVRSDDWRTEKDWLLVALEVLRAMPMGQGDWCKTVLPPGSTRASGNEPFWSVTLAPDGIEWNEPELVAPLRFPAAAPIVEGKKRTWISTLAVEGAPARELRVVIEPRTCQDSMSGAWYSSSAEITLDGRVMTGCAYDGE